MIAGASHEKFSGVKERVAPLGIGRQFRFYRLSCQYNGTCKIYNLDLLRSGLSRTAYSCSSGSEL